MTEECKKNIESFRKTSQTEILEIKSALNHIINTLESHCSRLEQVEDRISGLKEKI
jgi:DNA repair ATPase RecN